MPLCAGWDKLPQVRYYLRSNYGQKCSEGGRMKDEVVLMMDGQEVGTEQGKTLLEVARENGVNIPTICFHEATTSNALCRTCVVEVEGMRVLQPACIVEAAPGMKVQTNSERVVRARKTILEMLVSTMDLSDAPEIQAMMAEYGVDVNRF